MKVYNQEKTKELMEYDLNLGRLEEDKIFKEHHEATPFVAAVSAEENANRARENGIIVREFEGKFYKVIKTYDNGGEDCEEITAMPEHEAQDAYDEYEDIRVYIPFTAEELEERELKRLRVQRKPLLEAFDKWEKAVLRGREEESDADMQWYGKLLDLDETAFEDGNIPERVKYYL